MGLTSNERRAQRRKECREALVAHIYERLGLMVPPGRVRLQPSIQDGYAWSASASKQHLLTRNLASGTVGFYQDIMDGLGQSIEAVAPEIIRTVGQNHHTDSATEFKISNTESESFTVTIRRLEDENRRLTVELEHSQLCSEELVKRNQEGQVRLDAFEEEVKDCRSSISQLKEDLHQARGSILEAVKILQGCLSIEKDVFPRAEAKIDVA
ncbi:hypothetical protein N7466_011134 [Penicillium verhagenii]|uniref:uncharacterized protein n=1 Tax=Penicillium verhagenii TaxID=1562060 RepID=UPI002545984E|nr:uncharacterized protein N7466_011134 [Penicillium verhagenii]KAJ5917580.1 hypothetical protein N7466_011134 [Penicillium verhagenii]